MKVANSPSRRLISRITPSEDIWVYWHCKGREDISRIRDLSPRGLFLETPSQFPTKAETKLHFLVQEGEIAAQAIVCHSHPTTGLGLKFTSIREEHQHRLAALINRLRGLIPFAQKHG